MASAQQDRARPGGDPRIEFARFYDSEMPRVYRYICYHVGSRQEAEGVTTEALGLAWRRWPQASKQASPRAWLFTLANSCLAEHQRHERAQPAAVLDGRFDLPGEAPGLEAAAGHRQEVAALLARLHQLPERDRILLILHFAGGLDHRETGAVLSIGEDTSTVALLDALRRLRQLYEGEKR